MRQYELGEAFVNAIEREAGIHAVDPGVAGPRDPADARRALGPDDLAGPGRRRHRRRRGSAATRRGRRRPATAWSSTGSSRRSSSPAPAVPTRSRCSSSRPTPGSNRSRCTSTTACGPAARRDADVVRDAAARLGVEGRGASRWTSTPGGNLEARARDARYAALESARARARRHRDPRRAHRRRPGRDRAAQPAARQRRQRPRGHARAARPRRAPAARRAPRRRPRGVCRRAGFVPVDDPSNHDLVHRRNWVRLDALPALSDGRAARSRARAHPPGRRAAGRSGSPRRAG